MPGASGAISSADMTHVFIAPHPDDVALSCGGLVARLRERGQRVAIVTVFSGGARADGAAGLSEYQRAALGFGNGAPVPATAGSRQGDAPLDLSAADIARVRSSEDERYADMTGCSVVRLDLPDAVYRGYEGDAELLGAVRDDDPPPYEAVLGRVLRLDPQMVYAPLGVGSHVDHQLCREVALALLDAARGPAAPAPGSPGRAAPAPGFPGRAARARGFEGRVSFYEDFPYAWRHDFHAPAELPGGGLALPSGFALEARYTDIGEQLDRKAAGIAQYESQVARLFESERGMLDALAAYHGRVAAEGGIAGHAERCWVAVPL